MNTALSIHAEDQSDRHTASSMTGSGIRLVSGNEASAESTPASSVVTPKSTGADRDATDHVHAASPAPVQMLRPQAAPVSDIEHFAAQIDVEKVLLIPAGVSIDGDISTKGLASLVISGVVNGNVDAGAGAVIVRESGAVNGLVKSDDSVIVAGSITNDHAEGLAIATGGLWILTETGRVRGDVAYARHRAYEGAMFSGRAIPFSEYKG